MSSSDYLCLGCMRDNGGAEVCPYCGHRRGMRTPAPFLQEGRDIGGRYVIGKKLYSGGDGVTYIAWDLDLGESVYVREFLPDAVASREDGYSDVRVLSGCESVFADCRAEFYKLWSKLIKLRGLSALMPVREMINDYGTVYAVIENKNYITLEEYLYSFPGQRMGWEQLKPALLPLLSTAETLHAAGIIHGGISPQTVFVGDDGRFYIGRFCIMQARCAAADLNAEFFEGYAALEQYGVRQKPGTWTDVYALAALIYRCLTGLDPIPASQRAVRDEMVIPADVANVLPANVIDAVIDAFQTKPENRSADVHELRAGLLGQEFHKKVYPLSYYSYNDISYVNQDKKPYIAETEYFRGGGTVPPVSQRPRPAETARKPVSQNTETDASGKKGLIAFVIVLLLIAVGVGAYVAVSNGLFSNGGNNEPAVQTSQAIWAVPDLIGRTEVSVKSDAALREKFTLVYQQDYTLLAEEGFVFAQSIAAGTQMPAGTQLVVYVSLGPKTVNVPDVIGIDAEGAKAQLEALGLVVQLNEKSNDGSGTQGFVASVSPETGAEIKQGETVFVNVWGAPPTTTAVQTTANSNSANANSNSGNSMFGLPNLFDIFG